ncbi:MAG: gliding motility-associated C-terminal domain-containing protein, partial [Cyclobacteriaceae bacterium]
FRNGEKIGEVRRDFQMLAVAGCDFSVPPQVFAETPEGAVIMDATDTLRFTFEDSKCFNLVVTDEDPDEKITFEAIPINFEGVLGDIFQMGNGSISGLNDTLRVEVCLPDCPPRKDGLMVVDLLAKDDACAVPLIDTTRLVIVIEPPPNTPPVIEPKDVVHVVNTDSELYELVINATDLDDDDLIIDIIPDGFDPEEYGMSLEELANDPGALSSLFTWNADCRTTNLQDKNEFDLLIVVDDKDECLFSDPDTLKMKLVFELPPNTPPEISIEGLPGNSITVDVGTPIDLNLLGFDADGDSVFLELVPGDTAAIPGVNFASAMGIGNVSSNFTWSPTCDELAVAVGGKFDFNFLVADDQCFEQAIDTVTLTVNINNPEFSFEGFTPPNAFSPYNGDDKSEYWEVPNIPEGNCENQYIGIGIYNRWGKEVFASDLLDFRWDGGGAPTGVYYYTLKYSKSEFKGIIYLFDADPGNF